jgi:HEAT repeat protein
LGSLLQTLSPDALSLEAAAELLHSDDFYVRYSTTELLSKRAGRDARLLLHEVLGDAKPVIRASAARHLYYFSWFAAEPLLRQALADADYRVREGAVYALCQLRSREAFHLLEEVLPQEGDEARYAVAWALTPCPLKEAVPVLALAAEATEAKIRVKVMEALGTTESQEAVPVVYHYWQHDSDPEVLYAATLSLIELAGAGYLAEIAGAIRQRSGQARHELLRAFFHATSYLHIDLVQTPAIEMILDALAEALNDESAEVRQRAVFPLAWIQHPRAAALLEAAYQQETDSQARAHLIHVAVSFNSDAGRALLPLGLSSTVTLVRETAVQVQKLVASS